LKGYHLALNIRVVTRELCARGSSLSRFHYPKISRDIVPRIRNTGIIRRVYFRWYYLKKKTANDSKNNDDTFPITYICPIYLRLITLLKYFFSQRKLAAALKAAN